MKIVASGLVAIALLALYAYLVLSAIAVVDCATTGGCTTLRLEDFNDAKSQTMLVVSGLVSALVIAELAATAPGSIPGARALPANASDKARNVLRWVTGLYIAVWLFVGGWALLAGLDHPDTLPALTNVGQAWLGLSVASAYSYFGLTPG